MYNTFIDNYLPSIFRYDWCSAIYDRFLTVYLSINPIGDRANMKDVKQIEIFFVSCFFFSSLKIQLLEIYILL